MEDTENRFTASSVTVAGNGFSSVRNLPEIDTFNYDIESAFSRLSLTPSYRPHSGGSSSFSGHDSGGSSSFSGHDAAAASASVSLPFTFGQNQQSSHWAPAQSSNASANGPFGFPGAHWRTNVGPEATGFSWRSPYLHSGDHAALMNTHQRQDFILHDTEPFSRTNLNLRYNLNLRVEDIESVVPQVMEHLCDLMMSEFGSHFVPNLFSVCNEDQRTRIIASLTRHSFKFINMCLNSYGARAVQELLGKLISPQQISLVVSALKQGALALSTDINGHRVVDYCARHFSCEYVEPLFNDIANSCFRIATNKWGCCVLKTCLIHSQGKARQRLVNEILVNVIQLSDDHYGNYVVQCVLGMKMPRVTEDLLRRVQGYFVSFSFNKYASNVVEKFLVVSEENVSTTIILEILRSPSASMLLLDPFGNYVVQSALLVSKGAIREALLHLIQFNLPSMQCNLFGMKILDCVNKKLGRNLHHVNRCTDQGSYYTSGSMRM